MLSLRFAPIKAAHLTFCTLFKVPRSRMSVGGPVGLNLNCSNVCAVAPAIEPHKESNPSPSTDYTILNPFNHIENGYNCAECKNPTHRRRRSTCSEIVKKQYCIQKRIVKSSFNPFSSPRHALLHSSRFPFLAEWVPSPKHALPALIIPRLVSVSAEIPFTCQP